MSLGRRWIGEWLGTAGLLMTVVGSGIMGESLSAGNAAIALLANSVATGAGLYVLIQVLAPVSGAHFNPVVTFTEWLRRRMSSREAVVYIQAQLAGAVCGVMLAHALFGKALLQLSTRDRGDWRFAISEVVATCGLVTVIGLGQARKSDALPSLVALYIMSAYWSTSSTAFANPAVTLARTLTDTFSGVLWIGAPGLIAAQFLGAGLGCVISKALSGSCEERSRGDAQRSLSQRACKER